MQKIDLKVKLTGEHAKKFRHIKEKLGIKKDEDVLTYLINDSYERLSKEDEK